VIDSRLTIVRARSARMTHGFARGPAAVSRAANVSAGPEAREQKTRAPLGADMSGAGG
jgi:hypothetical protein